MENNGSCWRDGKRIGDKNTVHLLGQEISVERKALKIRNFEDITNGFTPHFVSTAFFAGKDKYEDLYRINKAMTEWIGINMDKLSIS